ncbi:MAG TPA: HD-GYP domain-containing protein [bacterium]|nr:HD-GYP domain-containing protein [bacterium]HEX68257.1 HD-GYP domain-containing protein [bacterium]
MRENENPLGFSTTIFEDLHERVNLLIRLRWGGILLLVALLPYAILSQAEGFPSIPLFFLLLLTLLFNLALHIDVRKHNAPEEIPYLNRALNLQLYYDIFFYLFVFHFTGGVESPFFILLIFPPISSTLILTPPRNYLRALFTFSLFVFLLFAECHWKLNPPFLMTISLRERVFLLSMALGGALGLSLYLTSSLIQRLQGRLKRLLALQRNLQRSYLQTVMALAQAVEARDPAIKRHLERSINYANLIGKKLGLDERDMEALKFGAVLHDIGKIGVDGNILFKPGKLTPEEFEEIKKHPEIGAEIIKGVEFLERVEPIILYHHERYDGKGYPKGLKGEEIPLLARIITVIESYEAMTSERLYKRAKSKEEAIEELKRERGKQFDPKIVDIFLKILEEEEG